MIVLRGILLSAEALDASLRFYRDAAGMPERFRDADRYVALAAGDGVTLALASAAEHPAPGTPVLAFKTSGLEAALRRLEAAGARILEPPAAGRHERRALVRAPGGALLSVYSPKETQP